MKPVQIPSFVVIKFKEKKRKKKKKNNNNMDKMLYYEGILGKKSIYTQFCFHMFYAVKSSKDELT